jgi:hypothetical protein
VLLDPQNQRGNPRSLELQENSVAAVVRSTGPTSPLPLRGRNGAFCLLDFCRLGILARLNLDEQRCSLHKSLSAQSWDWVASSFRKKSSPKRVLKWFEFHSFKIEEERRNAS